MNHPVAPLRRRSLLERALLHESGKPKKTFRRLLFHSNGRPRGIFRRLILRSNDQPRKFFLMWMSSPDYQMLPGAIAVDSLEFRALSPRARYFLKRLEAAQMRLAEEQRTDRHEPEEHPRYHRA